MGSLANNRVEYGFCSGVHHGNPAGFPHEPEAAGSLFLDQLGKLLLGFCCIHHLYITFHIFNYRARRILWQQGGEKEGEGGRGAEDRGEGAGGESRGQSPEVRGPRSEGQEKGGGVS